MSLPITTPTLETHPSTVHQSTTHQPPQSVPLTTTRFNILSPNIEIFDILLQSIILTQNLSSHHFQLYRLSTKHNTTHYIANDHITFCHHNFLHILSNIAILNTPPKIKLSIEYHFQPYHLSTKHKTI